MNQKIYVVIPAAGMGARMGAGKNKVFLELAGEPILKRTLDAFQALPEITAIQVVGRAEELIDLESFLAEWQITKAQPPVAGGETRQASVLNGLLALQELLNDSGAGAVSASSSALAPDPAPDTATASTEDPLVLIHDAARCLVSPEIIRECIRYTREQGACVAAIPVKDTIKRVDASGQIHETLDRSALWQIQTPQSFRFSEILAAYQSALSRGISVTDDAAVMEAAGGAVSVVEGSHENIKITTAEDLTFAEVFLRNRREVRK